MAGYLDQYGEGEDKRNKLIAISVASFLALLLFGSLGWYLLRNHHEESVAKSFVNALRAGDLPGAYRAWGCTSEKPCSAYSFDKFQEDWAPKNNPADPSILGVSDSESCGSGVLLTVQVNRAREEKLWVEKGTDGISYAPYPVCPHKSPFSIMMHRTVGQLRKPLLK